MRLHAQWMNRMPRRTASNKICPHVSSRAGRRGRQFRSQSPLSAFPTALVLTDGTPVKRGSVLHHVIMHSDRARKFLKRKTRHVARVSNSAAKEPNHRGGGIDSDDDQQKGGSRFSTNA